MAVSFIGGGNQSTRRKPPSFCKSLTNFLSDNVVSSTLRDEQDSPLKVMSSNPAQLRCTLYNIMWLSLSVTCGRYPVSSTNKTDRHNITEILFIVDLALTLPPKLDIYRFFIYYNTGSLDFTCIYNSVNFNICEGKKINFYSLFFFLS